MQSGLKGRRFYRLTINFQIVETHIFHTSLYVDSIFGIGGAFLHVVELAVVDLNVVDIIRAFETYIVNTEVTAFAGNVLTEDVAHRGREAAVANLAVLILKIDAQDGFAAHADLDVANKDILDDTTAAITGLNADNTVEVGAVHFTILYIEVLVTARNFATDDNATVTVIHLAVAHDDVLAGNSPRTTVTVAAALDSDAVVARVEDAVFDNHAVAGLGVATVTVGTAIDKMHAANDKVVAEEGVQGPER